MIVSDKVKNLFDELFPEDEFEKRDNQAIDKTVCEYASIFGLAMDEEEGLDFLLRITERAYRKGMKDGMQLGR